MHFSIYLFIYLQMGMFHNQQQIIFSTSDLACTTAADPR